jgi:hypothetical protein
MRGGTAFVAATEAAGAFVAASAAASSRDAVVISDTPP